jgi:hypothetical protein
MSFKKNFNHIPQSFISQYKPGAGLTTSFASNKNPGAVMKLSSVPRL